MGTRFLKSLDGGKVMATTTRLEFRIRPESKELIEQAAQLLGMSVSEFANSRLVQLARQVISEHNVTKLTNRDRDIFLAMLEADTEPNAALRKAFREVK
jgi:uncharacterized protein (DUF1778 family)